MEVPYGQLGSVRFDVVRFIDNIPWAIIPVLRSGLLNELRTRCSTGADTPINYKMYNNKYMGLE